MIIELWSVLTVLLAGSMLMRIGGLRGIAVPTLGFIVGLGLQISVVLFQIVTPLPTSPALTLVLTLALPTAWWLWSLRAGREVTWSLRATAVAAAIVTAAVVFLRIVPLVKWHGDSLRYIFQTQLLADDTFMLAAWNGMTEKRPVGVAAIHSAAGLQDEYYLRSLTPLLTVAALLAFMWFLNRGLHREVSRPQILLFGTLGVLFLLTSNRFVHHAFYLNGHLLMGVMVFVAAAAIWLLTRGEGEGKLALAIVILAAIAAAVVTRGEGAVSMLVVLAPGLISGAVSVPVRRAILVWLGAVMMSWFGFALWVSLNNDHEVSPPTVIHFSIGVALFGLVNLVDWKGWSEHRTAMLRGFEALIWAVLVGLTLWRPEPVIRSFTATVENQLGAGKWGLTIVAVVCFVVVIAIALRVRESVALRLPVTTFLPLVFVLKVIGDEGAFRVGVFDSLNRMWLHMLMLAVFYITVALASGEWKLPWPRAFTRARELPDVHTVRG